LVRRLGFTPQRPLYKAWQQNPALVDQWQKEEYPKIAKRAKKEGGIIFFADESGIRTDHHAGTTWAPKGQTPILKATGARQGVNMISAVNAQGHFRFKIVAGAVKSNVFLDFIKSLMVGINQKIFLIVDGHPTHKSKMLKEFLRYNQDKIELFYLPPYSPELNPDELAWTHVKNSVRKKVAQNKDKLMEFVKSALYSPQKLPHIVKSFFSAETCKYAVL
jgi:transposase